ncbi:MAG: hypothetical protein ACM3UZ_15025 [Acidobacteriota bacterium]
MNWTREWVRDLKKRFVKMDESIDETVTAMQSGNEGYQKLTAIVEEMSQLFESMAKMNERVSEDDSAFFQKMIAQTQRTNQVLNGIVNAMTSGDVVLIADLLQYELKERLGEWSKLLKDVEHKFH